MQRKTNISLVEVVWSDDKVSKNYIGRLNAFLNPYRHHSITTAMWNKEILPGVEEVNTYNRFMVVFDYDEHKPWQRCFSFSSPKPDDVKTDLRYYVLPNKQKLMLNSSIDIPSKYLIKADLDLMKIHESNPSIKRNLDYNIENLKLVKSHKEHILEQYEVIEKNIWTNKKFHSNNVKWAHDRMIDNKKQHQFCEKELLKIQEAEQERIKEVLLQKNR